MRKFPRGSEWRLWDLHIHTPASYTYSGGRFASMTAVEKDHAVRQIIENINTSDVAVFAINDYWTFDGFLALRAAHEAGYALEKTVFPAIELRIESGSQHRLNIHVIFSDKLTIQQLTDFKQELRLRLTDRSLSDESLIEYARQMDGAKAKKHGASDDYLNSEAELMELGAKTAEVTKASFEKALRRVPSDQRLVMIPYDCYGGMQEIDWVEQPSEDLYFMRLADIVEERNQKNIDLFSCRKTPANSAFIENFKTTIGGRPKPCVSGSDGHSIEGFKTWRAETKTKKTWIKADPTFEGLRQIIFEPAARVRVQEHSPETAYTKPFFSSVTITQEISPFPINPNYENPRFGRLEGLPLNSDLVCLIGGRGTGKSCLVDYVGQAFGPSLKKSTYLLNQDFAVAFNKDAQSASNHHAKEGVELPFVYISQNEVKSKVSTGTVGDEIKRMLGIQGLSFDSDLVEKIRELHNAVSNLNDWFGQTDEKGALIYERQAIELEIVRFNSLLESITTDQNKEKLERFTSNISQITSAGEKLKKLGLLKDELDLFKVTFDAKASAVDLNIPQLNISEQVDAIQAATVAAASQVIQGEAQNIQIRADFSQVYTGDLSGLLQNAEAYRASIERLRSNLGLIAAKQTELEIAIAKRAEVSDLISAELERQKEAIDERWQLVRQGQSDWTVEQRDLMKRILADRQISLEGKVIFDTAAFMVQLKDVLNLRSFRATNELTVDERVRQIFPITSADDFLKFMKTRLHTIETEDFVSGDLAGLFYDVTKRSKFLRVEPVISYGGRPLDRLSVGQKGTVYLCLKLATQAFTQPLIFDQPEDDLDNEFIIEELVDIFRGIKQYRQVILVSHNANLVVNADADQVIVAENDAGVLRYMSGSLEEPAINKAVRRILEGGDAAFLKRELRYNLK